MNGTDFSALNQAGLNLQAVFDLAEIAPAARRQLDPQRRYGRLVLIGHGGKTLWEQLGASGWQAASADPIDDFTRATLKAWLAAQWPADEHALLYPGDLPVGLQALGRLAGWHHESPFRVGVNAVWGSWFAYRAVLLTTAHLPATPRMAGESPCASCGGQPCVAACPAGALDENGFSLPQCLAGRRQPQSPCRLTCLARTRCPLRPEHRYPDAQMAHSYARSLAIIEQWHDGLAGGETGAPAPGARKIIRTKFP